MNTYPSDPGSGWVRFDVLAMTLEEQDAFVEEQATIAVEEARDWIDMTIAEEGFRVLPETIEKWLREVSDCSRKLSRKFLADARRMQTH